MKCERCGREIPDTKKVCDFCGFDPDSIKNLAKINVPIDPEVDDKHKIALIDMPILTFVLGLVSLLVSLMLAFMDLAESIIFIAVYFLLFALTFLFSTKPCKVKLKPVREMGIILGFLSFLIAATSIILVIFNSF